MSHIKTYTLLSLPINSTWKR